VPVTRGNFFPTFFGKFARFDVVLFDNGHCCNCLKASISIWMHVTAKLYDGRCLHLFPPIGSPSNRRVVAVTTLSLTALNVQTGLRVQGAPDGSGARQRPSRVPLQVFTAFHASLVALTPARDLLLRAKHLLIEAIRRP
jgi:hypothetical protein